jgi:hypothetical protein
MERRIKARRLDSELIFHRSGRPIGDFRKRWLHACRAAGVEGRLLYDLRRTAVRNMVRAGVDPAIAMKISGHRTRAVFDRYNIVDERDVRDAFQGSLPTSTPCPRLRRSCPSRKGRLRPNSGVLAHSTLGKVPNVLNSRPEHAQTHERASRGNG